MPTADKTEHDFLSGGKVAKSASLKEFLLGIMNERERKYETRFASIDKSLADGTQAIKEALAIATLNTKDALATANANTRDALASANASMTTMGASIESRLKIAMDASEKATLKAEGQVNNKFHASNQYRAQLETQQATFARQTEVSLMVKAMNEKMDTANTELKTKLDAAVAQLQLEAGRKSGMASVWAMLAGALMLVLTAAGVIAVVVAKH